MWFGDSGAATAKLPGDVRLVVSPALYAELRSLSTVDLIQLSQEEDFLERTIDFYKVSGWSLDAAQTRGDVEEEYVNRSLPDQIRLEVPRLKVEGLEGLELESAILTVDPRWQLDIALALSVLLDNLVKERPIIDRGLAHLTYITRQLRKRFWRQRL